MVNTHTIYKITNVIACSYCQTDEDGELLIGQPAKVSQVPGLNECPSCRASLIPSDIVSVGITSLKRCAKERQQNAA
jgi:hypothetical protein